MKGSFLGAAPQVAFLAVSLLTPCRCMVELGPPAILIDKHLLVSGNMDHNPRNPSSLILSHSHILIDKHLAGK